MVRDVGTIAVLGAGTMGHGIAQIAALADVEVRLRDVEEELARGGYENVERRLESLVERDELGRDEADAALDRITPLVDLESALAGVDFVIEAVAERLALKRSVLGEADAIAPDDAIFATNTSSLSVTAIAAATERPDRCCGLHFFNPPDRMALVEVVPGAETSDETVATAEAFARRLEKTPITLARESPGFVVNRVLLPAVNEAAWLAHGDEATVEEIDGAAHHALGFPMGTFQLADWIGLDVCVDVLEHLADELGPAYEPAPPLVEHLDAGRLGRKSGRGFYDYDGEVEMAADPGRERVVDALRAAMANEVAKLLGDDVTDAATVDRAMELGANLPIGPAQLADEAGLDAILRTLRGRHGETGAARYEPAAELERRAERGVGFHDDAADDRSDGDGDGEATDARTDGGVDESDAARPPREGEFSSVAVERDGAVGRLTIDRAEKHNTIDETILEELVAGLESLEDDDAIRAVVLSGAGDRAFSAGADLPSFAGDADARDAVEFSRAGQRAFGRLESSPLPVVAAVDGFCLGGGMELAACADLRVASERARFGQPERNFGLIPGWGGTQRLPRIVGEGRAREIVLTGQRYEPETMVEYGFVTEVVAPETLDERVDELAGELAEGPPLAHEAYKRALLAGRDDHDAGLEVEAASFGHLFDTADFREGLAAFEADREPEFEGR